MTTSRNRFSTKKTTPTIICLEWKNHHKSVMNFKLNEIHSKHTPTSSPLLTPKTPTHLLTPQPHPTRSSHSPTPTTSTTTGALIFEVQMGCPHPMQHPTIRDSQSISPCSYRTYTRASIYSVSRSGKGSSCWREHPHHCLQHPHHCHQHPHQVHHI
jgi:hypothetical protein